MRDVMIDIETMGRKPGCPVVSIGAATFDRYTGEVGNRIQIVFDFNDALADGRSDPDTIKRWLQQSPEARHALLRGTTPVTQGVEGFVNWFHLNCDGMCVWGNGATFDITILEHLFERNGFEAPWDFWAVRDCRTVEDLSDIPRKKFRRSGTHHSALDDAIYQVKYISAMIAQLKGRDSA